MRIDNRTKYNTEKITKILKRVHKQFCQEVKFWPMKDMDITIQSTRPGWKWKLWKVECSCGWDRLTCFPDATEKQHKKGASHHWLDGSVKIVPPCNGIIKTNDAIIKPYVSGKARLGGDSVWLNLPTHNFDASKFRLAHGLAWVYYHELYHTIGFYGHTTIPKNESLKKRVEWAKEMEVN